jgi:hypothetical protein
MEAIMRNVRCKRRLSPILIAALVVLTLTLSACVAEGAQRMTGRAWDACRDRVIGELEAAGVRDFGEVSAYTGATGTGAMQAVIDTCGYRPEQIDRAFCDDLYTQVYLSCREDGFEGMSMAATSWVLIFDPDGPLVGRLRRVCEQPGDLGRTGFGRAVCSESR